MEFELKKLSKDAIPAAMEKANTYRLLNEPVAAESICRDILSVDSSNEEARITLILSISDQFPRGKRGLFKNAEAEVAQLATPYHRAYYSGLILERQAMYQLSTRSPGSGETAFKLLRTAMQAYEHAQSEKPANDDESVLRWNTCARVIMNNPRVKESEDYVGPSEQFDG